MRFLLAALLLLPLAASAQGIQTPPNQAAIFTSSAPAGTNGFVCRTQGCRFDLGPGSTDFLASDGSNIVTPGFYVSGTAPNQGWLSATQIRIGLGVALGTCASSNEGTILRLTGTGGTNSGSATRLCACISDGAASPTYSWRNLISGTAGNSTTCNP